MAEVSDDVFLLDECPHDWLFPQCSAVVSFNLCFLVGLFGKEKKNALLGSESGFGCLFKSDLFCFDSSFPKRKRGMICRCIMVELEPQLQD